MNKVILMGRLTRDPNVRYTQQNSSQESMCVARYTLAVDRRGARDGQQSADFISCVAFGKNGEFAEKYFKQGTKLLLRAGFRQVHTPTETVKRYIRPML